MSFLLILFFNFYYVLFFNFYIYGKYHPGLAVLDQGLLSPSNPKDFPGKKVIKEEPTPGVGVILIGYPEVAFICMSPLTFNPGKVFVDNFFKCCSVIFPGYV